MMNEKTQWEFEWFYIIKIHGKDCGQKRAMYTICDKKFQMKKSKIKWHDGLNCYAFQSAPKTVWNTESLGDILKFLETLKGK